MVIKKSYMFMGYMKSKELYIMLTKRVDGYIKCNAFEICVESAKKESCSICYLFKRRMDFGDIETLFIKRHVFFRYPQKSL